MKNTVITVLALTSLGLAALLGVQWRKTADLGTQVALLQSETEAKSAQLAEFETTQEHSRQLRRDLQRQVGELGAQLQPPVQTQAVASPNPAVGSDPTDPRGSNETNGKAEKGFGNFLSNMMKDPEAKKLIQSQQRLVLDQLYDPLVKQLGLTPEETGQFKDLIADHAMKTAEKSFSLMDGSAATNRTELLDSFKADQKSFEDQVKQALGDDRYAKYKDYEQTVGERAQLNQFKQQTGSSDHPLTDQQAEQLLAMMKEEKQGAAASGLSLDEGNQDPAKLQSLLSEEKMQQVFEAQSNVSQRVYERARTVLYPDQLEAFGRFQTSQAQMMRMGVSMARKFFGPDKAAARTP